MEEYQGTALIETLEGIHRALLLAVCASQHPDLGDITDAVANELTAYDDDPHIEALILTLHGQTSGMR